MGDGCVEEGEPPWLRRHGSEALLVGGMICFGGLFLFNSTSSWRPMVSHTWHAKAQVADYLESQAEGTDLEIIRIEVSERGGYLDLEATYWRTLPSMGRHRWTMHFKYNKDRRHASPAE